MKEFVEKLIEKIKVTSFEIIVTGTKDKPYFEIKYKEVGKEDYNIGYSSYDLNTVFNWKDEYFEIVNQLAEEYKDKVIIDGQYCWQTCGATEHCKECNRFSNGDIDYYENYDVLAEEYNNKDCSQCSRRSWYQKGYTDAENKLAEEIGVSKIENTNILSELNKFLKEKFEYCAEQAGMNLEAECECNSEISSYFRERKELYLDRANIYGEVMREIDRLSEEYGKDTNVTTNADRIRSMSNEELAEFLCKITMHHPDYCPAYNNCMRKSKGGMKDWLQSEVKGSDV